MSKPLTVTITDSTEVALSLPIRLRRQAGIKTGDQLEVRVSGGIVTLVPKLPAADDEYTPDERRAIKAEVAEARKGPYHGPFKSGDEIAAYLKTYKRRGASSTKAKTPR